MAKDPAFLFYSSDFLSGTYTMTDEQVGKYIRLLCLQHQKYRLTEKELNKVLGENSTEVRDKFEVEIIKGEKFYYQKRLRDEAEKRKNYSESRRSNRNKCDNDNVHIYLILNKETNHVKIGSSVNPNRRLIELSQKAECELICYTEKTKQKAESHLHEKYKENRVFNEWYDIYDILEEVKTYMTNDMKLHMCKHMEDENENINNINISFEKFWNLYDKKRGDKTKLETKWNKLTDKDRTAIMDYIPKYKLSQPDKQYRKDPQTFLNNKSWNDELLNVKPEINEVWK